jgi:hypothetical protein
MSEFSELEAIIKSAEQSLNRGEWDRAEAGIDYANSIIRKANSSDGEDDDYDEDASNPSLDAADDDADGDDDEDEVEKASGAGKKPPKEKKPKPRSDKIDGLVDSLVDELKAWKEENAESAITATANLVDRLKAADLIEEKKRKKAA